MDAATIIFPIMFLCGAAIYRGDKNSMNIFQTRAMNRAAAFSQKISCGIAIYRDDKTNKYPRDKPRGYK